VQLSVVVVITTTICHTTWSIYSKCKTNFSLKYTGPLSHQLKTSNQLALHFVFVLCSTGIQKMNESLLACSEHHIRISGDTQVEDTILARNPFPFFYLHIICRDYMGKQGLD